MMKSRIILGMLILSLLPSAPRLHAAPQGAEYERYVLTRELISKAIRLLDEGKLNDAKSLFEKCAKQINGHYEAHFYLAQLAYENKDYSSALEHIQVAIGSLDALDRAYNHQSIEYQKRLAERRREYQHTVDLITTLSGGGSGGCKGSTLIEATQSLHELDSAASSPFAAERPYAVPAAFYFVQGNCLLRLKRNAEAREQYTRAIQVDPKHTESWNNLTYLWFLDKDPAAALGTIRKAEAMGVVINPALKSAILGPAKAGDSK